MTKNNIMPMFNRTYGHSTNKPLVNSVMTFDASTNTAGWDSLDNFSSSSKYLYNSFSEAHDAIGNSTNVSVLYKNIESHSSVTHLVVGYYGNISQYNQLDIRYADDLNYNCTDYLGVVKEIHGDFYKTQAMYLLPNIIDSNYYSVVPHDKGVYYLGNNHISVSVRKDMQNSKLYSGTISDFGGNATYRLQEPHETYKSTKNSFNIISYEYEMVDSKYKIFGGLTASSLHGKPVFSIMTYDDDYDETTLQAYNRDEDGSVSVYYGSLTQDYNFTTPGKYTSFQPINGAYRERFEYESENNLVGSKIENGKAVGALYVETAVRPASRTYMKFPQGTTPLSRVFTVFFEESHYRIRNLAVLVKNDVTNKKQIYGRKKRNGVDFDYLLAPDVKIDGTHFHSCQWGEKTMLVGIKTNQYSHFDVECLHTYEPYDSTDGTAWIKTNPYTMISQEYGSIYGFGGLPFYSNSEPIVLFTLVSSYKGVRLNAHIGYEYSRWGMVEGVGEISSTDYNETYEEMTVTKEGSNYIVYVTYSKMFNNTKKTRVEKIIVPESDIVLHRNLQNERNLGSYRAEPNSTIFEKYHGSMTSGNVSNNGEEAGNFQFIRKSYFSPIVDFKRRMTITKLEIPFVTTKNATLPDGLSIFIRDSKNNNLKICSTYDIQFGKIIFDIDFEFKSGRYHLFLMTKNTTTTNINRPFSIMTEFYDKESSRTREFIDYGDIVIFGNQSYNFSNPSVVPEEGWDYTRCFSVFRMTEKTEAGKNQ